MIIDDYQMQRLTQRHVAGHIDREKLDLYIMKWINIPTFPVERDVVAARIIDRVRNDRPIIDPPHEISKQISEERR